jgi:hypothetical protein
MVTPVASRRLLYVVYDDNQNKQKRGKKRDAGSLTVQNDVAYSKISLSANDERNGERERASRKFCVLGVKNLGAVSALRCKPNQNLYSGR